MESYGFPRGVPKMPSGNRGPPFLPEPFSGARFKKEMPLAPSQHGNEEIIWLFDEQALKNMMFSKRKAMVRVNYTLKTMCFRWFYNTVEKLSFETKIGL